jgi:phthalate 4,5-dioxygenase oxygenase subunit
MYLQDRQAMKLGNHTGVPGIPNQDIIMWETMGPITDRSEDRLGASDLAIVEFRRQMLDAVRTFEAGGPVIGRTEPHIPHVHLCSFEGVVPKTEDWRTLGVSAEERAMAAGEAHAETAAE